MNENVKTKTPKRRRWVARLLVSALCILLASSLLFVGVVAENVNTFTFQTVDQSVSDSKRYFGYHFGSDGNMGLTEISVNPSSFQYVYIYKYGSIDPSVTVTLNITNISVFGGCSSGEDWIATWYYDGSVIVVNVWDFDGNRIDFDAYSVSSFQSFYYSSTIDYFCFYNGSSIITKVSYSDGSDNFNIRYLGDTDASSLGFLSLPLFYSSQWVFYVGDTIDGVSKGGVLYSSTLTYSLDSDPLTLTSRFFVFSGNSIFGVYRYGGSVSSYSIVDGSYVGNSVSNIELPKILSVFLLPLDSSSFSSSLVGYGIGNSSDVYSAVYGTSSEYVPPESSDETSDTSPPESSDETSDPGDIPEGYTKIWYATLDSDGSYSSRVIGAIDLREAVEVRAYLGSWTSIDASFQSDVQVPLTIQVFNSEEGPPVVYTYDYYAAGYAVDSGIPDDFVFPDFIGDYVTLPYNGELNVYFADVSPSGTVLVSTPATWGGRVTLNLTSFSSYFRLDFIDEDTFAVVVFNNDGPGSRVNFNFDIRAYREYYVASDGDKTTSRWFTPSFGTSVSYSSERILNDGLYMIFVDSYNDTEYPWENGDWSSAIDDISSRLDDLSYDHALLESLANDAYGDFPFGPANRVEFDEAISNFETIKDSSGGDYIFRYMSGLWTIHPFASSMVIIVGTFAIIGFIIRKL